MQPHRRIILMVEATSSYGRGCLRGIARYARSHGGWAFMHSPRSLIERMQLRELQSWNAEGVIARIENPHTAELIRQLAIPTVDLRAPHDLPGVAGVYTDDRKVMDVAETHLINNGLKRLAFCGYPGIDFSDSRQAEFLKAANGERIERLVFDPPPLRNAPGSESNYERRGEHDAATLQTWLKQLPKPIGIIACNDTRARQVLLACMAAEVRVPYDVSVVGVDDDDVTCELSFPTLSSVAPNVEMIGYEAASLLDRMIRGEPPPAKPLFIPPVGIEIRNSSDVLALSDPTLVKAVQIIRSKIDQGINVKEVLAEVHVSRSTFERQFREHLGCTPYDYILRCRIDRIRQLLVDTNYSLAKVTKMAGLRSVAHMTAVFRQKTGMTPAAYRQQNA